MTHKGSSISFRITKKGNVKITQKEVYVTNAGDEVVEKFPSEYSLNRDNINELVTNHALSWIRGDSIREEAKDD